MTADTHVPRRHVTYLMPCGRPSRPPTSWCTPATGSTSRCSTRSSAAPGGCSRCTATTTTAPLRERLPEVARAEVEGVRLAVVHETGDAKGREARCARAVPRRRRPGVRPQPHPLGHHRADRPAAAQPRLADRPAAAAARHLPHRRRRRRGAARRHAPRGRPGERGRPLPAAAVALLACPVCAGALAPPTATPACGARPGTPSTAPGRVTSRCCRRAHRRRPATPRRWSPTGWPSSAPAHFAGVTRALGDAVLGGGSRPAPCSTSAAAPATTWPRCWTGCRTRSGSSWTPRATPPAAPRRVLPAGAGRGRRRLGPAAGPRRRASTGCSVVFAPRNGPEIGAGAAAGRAAGGRHPGRRPPRRAGRPAGPAAGGPGQGRPAGGGAGAAPGDRSATAAHREVLELTRAAVAPSSGWARTPGTWRRRRWPRRSRGLAEPVRVTVSVQVSSWTPARRDRTVTRGRPASARGPSGSTV